MSAPSNKPLKRTAAGSATRTASAPHMLSAEMPFSMSSKPQSARELSVRWIKSAAVVLLVIWLVPFLDFIPYLLGLNYAGRGELLRGFLEMLAACFGPLLFVAPVAWAWPSWSDSFRTFDSWPVFFLVGFLLFPVVAFVAMLAAAPFVGSTLGGGAGMILWGLFVAFETSLAYGAPRLILPSLRPGRFRKATEAAQLN